MRNRIASIVNCPCPSNIQEKIRASFAALPMVNLSQAFVRSATIPTNFPWPRNVPMQRKDAFAAPKTMPIPVPTWVIDLPEYIVEERLLQRIKTEKDKRRRGRLYRKIKRLRKIQAEMARLVRKYQDKMITTLSNGEEL